MQIYIDYAWPVNLGIVQLAPFPCVQLSVAKDESHAQMFEPSVMEGGIGLGKGGSFISDRKILI